MSPYIAVPTWRKKRRARLAHGHRRGLAPLLKRLTKRQLLVRQEHIDWRAEQKRLTKLVQRRAARKGTAK